MLTYVDIMDFHGDSTPQKDDPANEGFFVWMNHQALFVGVHSSPP